jgi:hypothetical protein
LITGSISPFCGGLLSARAGKTMIENKEVIMAKTVKFFFILSSPLDAMFMV